MQLNFENKSKKILIFDSGIGGFSIVNEIINRKIAVDIDYLADTEFFPYGNKSDLDLIERIPKLINKAVNESQADAVIIACNTASTIALFAIRALVNVPVIGVVPAIKPAAMLTKSKSIGLLATPRTIGSAYTDQLIEDFAANINVFRYGPPDLARAAEEYILNGQMYINAIKQAIDGIFSQKNSSEIDVIILACTHYPLIKDFLEANAPHKVNWIDSGAAIAKRVVQILELSENQNTKMNDAYSTNGNDEKYKDLSQKYGFANFKRINL